MKEYKLNENEHNYLISIVANTKRKYFTKEFRRNEMKNRVKIVDVTLKEGLTVRRLCD